MTNLGEGNRSCSPLSVLFVLALAAPGYVWGAGPRDCNNLSYNGGNEWYPFFYRDGQNAYGIANDTLINASKNVNQSLNLGINTPWKRQLLELKFGKLDLVAGATKTQENEKHFILSPAVTQANLTVFTKRDSDLELHSRNDLKSLKGVKLIGMSFGDDLREYVVDELVVEETLSLESVFRMLEYGRVDYAIAYEKAGIRFVKKLGLDKSIRSHSLSLESESVHILSTNDNKCSRNIDVLFDQIGMLKLQGEVELIVEKYSVGATPQGEVSDEI